MTKPKVDIYLITDLVNNKQYVGQTAKGYKYRFRQHCNYALGKRKTCSQLIDAYIKEIGIENFKIELLESVEYDQRNEKEQYYIKLYDTYSKGYNCTIGGDYNPMLDKEILNKHKIIMNSDKIRLKISKGVLKSLTPERIEFFRQFTTNRWINWDDQSRNNCIKGFIEYNNSKKQKIACLDRDENILHEFESASVACRYFNRPSKEAGHILRVCDKFNKDGKRAKHFGFSWIKL